MAVEGAPAARMMPVRDHRAAAAGRGRLAVFATHPIQYQCPLWRKLQEACDLDVRVYFLSDFSARAYHDREFGKQVAWSTPLLEGYDHEAFGHDQIRSLAAAGPPRLLRRLRRFAPHACLINGYVPLYYWHAAWAARRLRVPVLLRTEATDDDRRRSPWWEALRTAALRGLYAGVSRFLAIGVNARRHYERLGVPAARIGFAPYCTDTDFFEAQRREAVRGPLRRRLGIPDDACLALFCGKLIAKKDPQLLVEALAGLPDVRGRPLHAMFMGDGELRGQLEDAARRACPGRVHFLGYKPQHEMGEVYANGDMIVLPSRWSETWGLVVNEALQFGLPAIVSDRVGCGPDLIHEGATGFVFPAGRADELRRRLAALAILVQDDRAALAERCRTIVDRYSLHNAARGIDEAFRAVRDGGR